MIHRGGQYKWYISNFYKAATLIAISHNILMFLINVDLAIFVASREIAQSIALHFMHAQQLRRCF